MPEILGEEALEHLFVDQGSFFVGAGLQFVVLSDLQPVLHDISFVEGEFCKEVIFPESGIGEQRSEECYDFESGVVEVQSERVLLHHGE